MRITAIILILFLAACAPSQGVVQTAIAETQADLPVVVEVEPTATREPTQTFTHEPTATKTRTQRPTKTETPTADPLACTFGNVTDAIQNLAEPNGKFQDALNLSVAVTKSSLPDIVADMQDIKREAEAITVPVCATEYKQQIILFMQLVVEAQLIYLGNGNISNFEEKIEQAKAALTAAEEAREVMFKSMTP